MHKQSFTYGLAKSCQISWFQRPGRLQFKVQNFFLFHDRIIIVIAINCCSILQSYFSFTIIENMHSIYRASHLYIIMWSNRLQFKITSRESNFLYRTGIWDSKKKMPRHGSNHCQAVYETQKKEKNAQGTGRTTVKQFFVPYRYMRLKKKMSRPGSNHCHDKSSQVKSSQVKFYHTTGVILLSADVVLS